ncbi:MAG TPA: FAD-dependent oxidoreductase, partial [Ramlibacter sp.]|nr:FAD-dependent oxidoreductase [Ramlibacter sp.]
MAEQYQETGFSNGYEFTQGTGYALPEYPFREPPELRSGQPGHHAVVIVGGGITGLTVACALAQYGIAAVLLDEDNTVGVKGASSRGICYTQKSLEIFHRLGIYERIAAKGVQWSVGRTFAGKDEVYSFDLRQQSAFNLSSQPPFINIQQFYIEGYLVERIYELGRVELRWKNRVTGFEQDASGATLTVETPAGSYSIRADYVIDATGSHSPFRKWVGASVTARKGDDRWCIADVRFGKHPPVERHTWVEAPFNENRAVWQHLMGDDVWRIDYQMAPDADPAQVSREDVVRERLARQFGADCEVEVVWVGPYAYRSECIDAMRHGRVFFMGDAAKVVSPFGARGGNTGIADADNLAWKLAAVLQGRAAPALLESYHQERHEAARQNVQVTNRTARFLRPATPVEKLFRDAALSLARQHVFARQFVNTGRMAVAN